MNQKFAVARISRGEFLKSCSVALIGAVAGLRWNPFEAVRRFRIDRATASLFREHLNEVFTVRAHGSKRTPLVLVRVNEHPPTRLVEQFSVIFHAPAGTAIPDGIHTLRHAILGDCELFIGAVGMPNDRRVAYEACFGRHRGATMPALLS